MSRNVNGRVSTRPMPQMIADAIAILQQDASEYAFIGLVGGAAGGIVVLVLALIGGAIAVGCIAPALLLIAVGTLATSSAALGAGANQLQPDASRAFAEAGQRSIAVVRPWLPLAVALGVASYAAAALSSHLGPIPPEAVMFALAAMAAGYALPRSLHATVLFEHNLSAYDALRASTGVARMTTRPVAEAWCIVLAPAILVAALGAVTGIDLITGTIFAVLFVSAMPGGAALMSLIFLEAVAAPEASRMTSAA